MYANSQKKVEWMLDDEMKEPAGAIKIINDNAWALWDKESAAELGKLQVGSILTDIGAGWPTSEQFEQTAQTIIRQINENFKPYVESYLRWFPLLLEGRYDKQPEFRARLALLFACLAADFKNPGLLPTQVLLDRQAYEALAELYENEPASDSTRYSNLEQAFKQAFRTWQPRITNPGDSWLFAYLELSVRPGVAGQTEVIAEGKDVDNTETARRREAAMLTLLTTSVTVDFTKRTQLRRFFREQPQGQEAVRTLIERWFLPRYDLQPAEQLKATLYSLQSDNKHGYLPDHAVGWPRWLHRSQTLVLSMMAIYLLLAPLLWTYLQSDNGVGLISWLTGALYFLGGLPPIVLWFTSQRPDLSLPRLVAGVLVALVGTILQQRWDAVLRFVYLDGQAGLRFAVMTVICLGLLLAAIRVMVMKIEHATGYTFELCQSIKLIKAAWQSEPLAGNRLSWQHLRNAIFGNEVVKRIVLRRALTVIGRGLQLSFLLSLLLVDMLGSSYLAEVLKTCDKIPRIPGVFGFTYPILVLFLTTLMLFAGVFTQFIWDDTALTEAVA